MPNVKVVNMAGKEVGEITLSDALFGAEVNETVLHTAVRAYLMNQRQGTQSTLTRTEVSGGGRKPWRQKGSGRARQGSTRSPQWTHGGVALGPKPREYRVTLNKKTKRLALKSALSDKVACGNMVVVDSIVAEEYKTKTMKAMLEAIGAAKKALVVLPEADAKVIKSFANIPGVKTVPYHTINVYDVLNADTFVIAKAAAEKLEEVFA
jgi:large subunit ribosomal protein L4